VTQEKPTPSRTLPPEPAGAAEDAELVLSGEGADKAMPFEQVRAARRAELTEDYLELIADLIDESGEARATDLSRRMGVSHATVIKIIGRLKREGLVNSQPYRSIFLTEAGRRIAEESKRKHDIVLRFLLALGVSPGQADIDSEGMEHHVSDETLALFESFIRKHGAEKG
jgi:DtxR family manganese transport transcriptional regulator